MKFFLNTDKKGFTILEVIIALLVFSIGVLALGRLQFSSIKGNSSAFQFTEAMSAVQNEIDSIIALPYNNSSLDDGASSTRSFIDRNNVYTVSYNVAEDNPVINTKRIEFRVTWTDDNRTRSFTTNYYKSIEF